MPHIIPTIPVSSARITELNDKVLAMPMLYNNAQNTRTNTVHFMTHKRNLFAYWKNIFIIRYEDTRDFSHERNRTGIQRISMNISLCLPVVPILTSPFFLFCDRIIPSGIPSDADFSDRKGFLCSRHDSGSFVVAAGRFHFLSLIYKDIVGLDSVPCGTDRPFAF